MEAIGIHLSNIHKTFIHRIKGKVKAVDNVNLDIEHAKLVTLLGPSGCGKTTTLRMVAGFEQPDQGTIFLGEENVTNLLANKRNIGFVFQNYALFPHLSIYENVAYGLKVKGVSPQEEKQRVDEILAMVGLTGYEAQFPHQISGGEQQRVALARAIVIRPKVLLLDEPLSNLDAKLRVHTRSEIRRLQQSLHMTSIYVTHDQEEAMAISDHIAIMNKGKIIQVGTAEDLYFQPNSEFVAKFIGRINTLPAEVQEVENGFIMVKIFNHAYKIAAVSEGIKPQQKINVFIRPEFVQLSKKVEGKELKGIVTEKVFLGEKVEFAIDVYGHSLNITSYNAVEYAKYVLNQEVEVHLAEKELKIFKEKGD
ncbi:MAG TPA: ABC transporter ATP-binding protein [Candidatus Atribacteria bacterium]|nr:ABC transporter ATP-binding protein [Candidatus Atribacteria bacterium]